jgi:hypothetical protein
MYKSNTGARSRNQSCSVRAIIITYSDCVSVTLVIQHAMRMRRATLSSVDCPALFHFTRIIS